MVSFRRLISHRRHHDPAGPAPIPERAEPVADPDTQPNLSTQRTSDPPGVVFARGSFTGTPLTDTPEPGSLRSSYGSAVQPAPPVLPPILPSLPVGGPIAPGALLAGPAPLSTDAGEVKDPSSPVRAAHNREGDVHSSLHGDIGVVPGEEGLRYTSLDSQYSDPFKTPPRTHSNIDGHRAHIPAVIYEGDESRTSTPNTNTPRQQSGVSSETTERATPKQRDHQIRQPNLQPNFQTNLQNNPSETQPGDQVEYLHPLEAIDRISSAEHSGASTPAHFFSSASTPLPHTPRSEPASPPDSPHLSPLHAGASLPSTPEPLREVSRSPPASRHNTPPPAAPSAPIVLPSPVPAPSPIPAAPWGAQKHNDAAPSPVDPPGHDCTSHRVLLHSNRGHKHKQKNAPETQNSYRPRPESISSTSPSSSEDPPAEQLQAEKQSRFHISMPRWRRESSTTSDEEEDSGLGLRPLEIKADSEEMAAGTRSIAWCDDLKVFHGPIPARVIGGRFPPLELVGEGEKSPLARAKTLPKAGLKRVGSAISSVASSRAGSRSGSRTGSRAASISGKDEGMGKDGGQYDNTFGLAINDALQLSPRPRAADADNGPNDHDDHAEDDDNDDWLASWPHPRPPPSKLNLSDPLSGRTYTASRLGASIGSKKIVKFFLGAESDHAQSEARAYELTADSGLTGRWYGAYGGFHPRIGSRGVMRANQVLLYALVLEEVGEAVVVEKLWKKEKRAIAKLYQTLHAHGVLHNNPSAEHWRSGKNGFRLVSFSEALFRDDMDEEDWEEVCRAEDRVVLNILGLGEDRV